MAKQWASNEVPQLVDSIYKRVLERGGDASGSKYYGDKLSSGEMSVRDVVRMLGSSEEHHRLFVTPNAPHDGVKACYKHFLARDPEPEGSNYWTALVDKETDPWPLVINGIIDSEEYTRRFGDDTVPA